MPMSDVLKNFPALRIRDNPKGKEIQVKCNMIRIQRPLDCTVHHYHVSISPEVNKKIMPDFWSRIVEVYKNEIFDGVAIAFDGMSMLITNQKLKQDNIKVEFKQGKEGPHMKVYNLEISFKNSYDLSMITQACKSTKAPDISTYIQCFEIITRQYQESNYFGTGRKCYTETDATSISKGLEIWNGLSQTLKISNIGPALNVDLSFAVFYEPITILNFISKISARISRGREEQTNFNNLPKNFWIDLERALKNLNMITLHRKEGKNFTIKLSGISSEPANELTFEMENGVKMTIAEYFAKAYHPLNHPNLPVAIIKKKGKLLYYPLEVLQIKPRQKCNKKLDEFQTSEMLKLAAKTPNRRFEIIQKKISELKINSNKKLDEFGIAFDNKFINCKGYVLTPPTLQFSSSGKKQTVQPERGGWNLRDVSAIRPVTIKKWLVIYLHKASREAENNIDNAMSSLIRFSQSFGLNLSKNYKIINATSPSDYLKQLRTYQPEFCIVILPDKTSSVYQEVKCLSETNNLGIVTQCILLSNLSKCRDATFCSNLMIKINVKMGGINNVLADKCRGIACSKDTIVFGADVTHPGAGDLDGPSIVAVVASMNDTLTKYSTIIRVQERREEVIEGLSGIVKEMLLKYKSFNNVVPSKMIFFRDGVGESQFYSVFENEICAIKDAISQCKIKMELTFIVVQKRHSIRFKTDDDKQDVSDYKSGLKGGSNYRGDYNNRRGDNRGGDRNPKVLKKEPTGNVVPGTVIDDICHPVYFDFYLVSHHALQGTARPIRYQVLYNESNYDSGSIMNMVYGLCHLYARATKAVSIVHPIYYAHLAAARAKCYLRKTKNSEVLKLINPTAKLEDNLYYL
ncbi:Protein argonaute 1B [Astathelohania contejeani]|uniref:Protein argonaute 1B n=1 Tax=Astathelohania contejeani TaxID=164912 RepID=A0ABQ7I2M8_9MICR|nr:Protein argonaute 1B [Thelohania contejeani]